MIVRTGKHKVIVDATFKVPRGKWIVVKGRYACLRSYNKSTGQCDAVYLHRHIMKSPKGRYIDHVNRNPLDNRKANLRVVDCLGNAANRTARGYTRCARSGKYMVRAVLKGRPYFGGVYDRESHAKIAAKVLWGILYGKMRHAP